MPYPPFRVRFAGSLRPWRRAGKKANVPARRAKVHHRRCDNAKITDEFCRVCDDAGITREAVEAEAMSPNDLRAIVRAEIESLIDHRLWDLEKQQEENDAIEPG